MPDNQSPEADLLAIEALNAQDAKAVLANDVATITSQWSDDFVVLSEGPIVRGRSANAAAAERSRQLLEAIEPIEYVANFEEIQIFGDYAYEWGTFRSSMRPRDPASASTAVPRSIAILICLAGVRSAPRGRRARWRLALSVRDRAFAAQ